MPGVPREVIEHHLAVCPGARPVKQKIRHQAPEKQEFIIQEVEKLKKAKFVREVAIRNGLPTPLSCQRLAAACGSVWTSRISIRPAQKILFLCQELIRLWIQRQAATCFVSSTPSRDITRSRWQRRMRRRLHSSHPVGYTASYACRLG